MESKTKHFSMEINQRFFKAFEELISKGRIESLTAFCDKYGLYRIKYSRIRSKINFPSKETDYKYVDTAAIGYLVRDFNINAEWILVGRGEMFR